MAALLAIAGLVLGAPPAKAVLVNDWVSGDLLIGFRASGGNGTASSYLVNIGPRANYTSATPAFSLSVGDVGADLVATYGSNWATRTDLFWGVVGTTDTVGSTLYASRVRPSQSTQSTPWPGITSQPTRQGIKTDIVAVATDFNTLQATANSTHGAIQTNFNAQASWNYQVTNFPNDFGTTTTWTSIEGAFGASASKALDLYQFDNSGVSYRGVFSIAAETGQISFNAVPEPSTYALLAITGTVFLVFIRRRRAALKA